MNGHVNVMMCRSFSSKLATHQVKNHLKRFGQAKAKMKNILAMAYLSIDFTTEAEKINETPDISEFTDFALMIGCDIATTKK